MVRWLGLAFLAGCGSIDVQVEMFVCTDVTLDAEPALFVEEDGDDFLLFRKPVFAGDKDLFDPEITFEGRDVFVYEHWVADPESGPDFCISPAIRIVDPPKGKIAVEWYLDDAVIPEYREVIKP